jgi:acetyl esterase/lipase
MVIQPLPEKEIPLWAGGAPYARGSSPADIPTLTVFAAEPDKASGSAMVICPGGGYANLADHEGEGYARWLSRLGITCLVLKYRLGSRGYRHPVMLSDVARALRFTRFKSAEWKIDSRRIGLMGSSAGGHLTATLLTHFNAGNPDDIDLVERVSSRPDLGILCYPVITMGTHTHAGSKQNLLGDSPSPDLVTLLSNEQHVRADSPHCFIWHTEEDATVPVENALVFAAALRQKRVPFELHIYRKGVHGLGLGGAEPDSYHRWTSDCLAWLREEGFLR